MVYFEATSFANWMQNFIDDLGFVDSIDRPIKVHCDTSATLSFSNNLKRSQGARYIDVKFYKVKDEVEEGLNNQDIDLGIFETHVFRIEL